MRYDFLMLIQLTWQPYIIKQVADFAEQLR